MICGVELLLMSALEIISKDAVEPVMETTILTLLWVESLPLLIPLPSPTEELK